MPKIKVISNGKQIVLNDKDYLSGGEGSVYIQGQTAYKIYHDRAKMIPRGKIQELLPIASPNVLAPRDVLFDEKGNEIGFTMQYVSGTISLTQLFTTSFRQRFNVSEADSVKLVNRMIEVTQFIHDNKVLIVDGNEFNYLVDEKTLVVPYFIDVDSYQTRSYGATAIMPSVRDLHSKTFTELSDWFSFAVVATQIFVGIHPYKGKHPNYAKYDMEKRMLDNVSIFNKSVSIPSAARSLDCIPSDMRKWLEDVLEKGKRILPPSVITGRIVKPTIEKILRGSGSFNILKIFESTEKITGCEFISGKLFIYTTNGIKQVVSNKLVDVHTFSDKSGILYNEENGLFFVVDIDNNNEVVAFNINTGENIKTGISAGKKMIFRNNLYVLNNDMFSEVKVTKLGNKIVFSINNTYNILPNSTRIYRGMLYSDVLGTPYLYIPYEKNKMHICKMEYLRGYRILDAKYSNNICVIIASRKNSTYDRITIKFKFDENIYNIEKDEDITVSSVNSAVLENGICVLLTGDDSIEVFSKAFSSTRKIVENAGMNGNEELFSDLNKVYFHDEYNVYSFSMK